MLSYEFRPTSIDKQTYDLNSYENLFFTGLNIFKF